MKVKIKDLHSNPYKKWINNGKLNQEQIGKLKANMSELGLMGSIPVVKMDGKYHLVSHHHRVEALKQIHGDDYEIEVDLHDYSDAQLFRGMVIENLTQRKGDFMEEGENTLAVEKFLTENKKELTAIRDSRIAKDKGMKFNPEYKDIPSAEDIARWIDPDYKIISHDKVSMLLRMFKKLDPTLLKEIEKTHVGDRKSVV